MKFHRKAPPPWPDTQVDPEKSKPTYTPVIEALADLVATPKIRVDKDIKKQCYVVLAVFEVPFIELAVNQQIDEAWQYLNEVEADQSAVAKQHLHGAKVHWTSDTHFGMDPAAGGVMSKHVVMKDDEIVAVLSNGDSWGATPPKLTVDKEAIKSIIENGAAWDAMLQATQAQKDAKLLAKAMKVANPKYAKYVKQNPTVGSFKTIDEYLMHLEGGGQEIEGSPW